MVVSISANDPELNRETDGFTDRQADLISECIVMESGSVPLVWCGAGEGEGVWLRGLMLGREKGCELGSWFWGGEVVLGGRWEVVQGLKKKKLM